MTDPAPRTFVGIDWAQDKHDVCIRSPEGKTLAEFVVANTAVELAALSQRLSNLVDGSNAEAAIAIEIPHGPVVETLLDAGFSVFSINTKQADRFRDRFSLPGAKDDRLDALVLADSLRTDGHLFRRLELLPAVVVRLRQLSRLHDELQKERNGLANRFRQQLRRYFPALLNLGDVTEHWLLDLWQRGPTPESARRLRKTTLTKLLKKRRIRRIDANTIATVVREPALTVAPGTAESAVTYLELLLPRLRAVSMQLTDVEARISSLLASIAKGELGPERMHRDVAIMLSFPGLGMMTAATLLAEATQALRDRSYHTLRALAGVAPITRRSGKGRPVVLMRQACNDRLRNATYHWARVASQNDDYCRNQYRALRARGCQHGRACRTVADRLLKVLCAALDTGVPYDPKLRGKPRAA